MTATWDQSWIIFYSLYIDVEIPDIKIELYCGGEVSRKQN